MAKWIKCLTMIICLGTTAYSGYTEELTLDDIFPTDRVLDIQITVSEKDWNKIRFQSRNFVEVLNESRQFAPPEHPYAYVEASVSIDGVVFPKVGIRKKGFIGSQSHTRPSLKIKLNHIDKKGEIEGLTNLTLNNNQQDGSQLSQFMGYSLFNAIGSPAPRCAYAKVTVNGKNLGVYSHVESARKPLLKRAFGNDKGPLYEGTVVDFYKEWENSFEHKRGDDTRGREKIKALIDVLTDDQVTEKVITEHVDLDSFYRFWATEGLLGFWDGYSGNNNNFFVYLNPETDKFHFLPWGADALFTKFSMLNFRRNSGAPISVKTQGLVAYKLYQLEAGRERYAKTMMKILENHWNEDKLIAEVDRISALIEPHLIPGQRSFKKEGEWGEEGKVSFADKLEEARDFIRTRKNEIMAEITDSMPIWKRRPHPPIIIGPDGFDGKFMKQFIDLPEDNLWAAARLGDLDGIKRYLSEGADINELSPQIQMSPLAFATMMGHTKAAELLIQLGADVNIKHEDGGTPLHLAVFIGRAEVAELLIKEGADVNAKNLRGDVPASALHLPWGITRFLAGMFGVELKQEEVEAGRAKIAEMLNSTSSSQHNLWQAAAKGDLSSIKDAIDDGVDTKALDPQFGITPLAWATMSGQTDAAKLLIEKGADVDGRNRDGATALHSAAFLGRVETVKLLLEKGADVNARSNDGSLPVNSAQLEWGMTQFVLGLLQMEVDETEVKTGRAEVVKLLSAHMKNAPQSRHNLWQSAATGDLTAIKSALDDGVDSKALDPLYGITPLGWSALSGQTEATKLLIEKGADINARNRDGTTALHGAAFLGRVETAKLLIEKGADINAQGNDGSLPTNSAQVDWGITKFVIGLLKLEADEAEVKTGRVKIVELLSGQKK